MKVPRLRVFAGPNGSGKSTIKADVPPALTRVFVNADELEKEAKATGFIDLSPFGIESTLPELVNFHVSHYLIRQKNLIEPAKKLRLPGNRVDYRGLDIDSYFASVISDYIRQHLLERRTSFSFETVMSHPSKSNLCTRLKPVATVPTSIGTELEYRTEDIPDWFFESYVDEAKP
ncbi:hypothetical protein [Pseudomonas sp. NPDC012596]|uniref:hypothetical protein n=1 Tax=Pseudomonas sp. NPDC012596 TaxID=3364419 RepID=UPI0036A9CBF0